MRRGRRVSPARHRPGREGVPGNRPRSRGTASGHGPRVSAHTRGSSRDEASPTPTSRDAGRTELRTERPFRSLPPPRCASAEAPSTCVRSPAPRAPGARVQDTGAHRAALLRDQARPVRQPHGARAPRASLLPARDPRLRPSPPPARPSSPLRPRPRPGLPRRAPPWRGPRSPPHGPLGSAVRSLPAASSELLGGESTRLIAWVAHSRAGEPRPTGCGGGTRAPGGAGQVRPRPVPERPGPREPRAHPSAHPRASVCIS